MPETYHSKNWITSKNPSVSRRRSKNSNEWRIKDFEKRWYTIQFPKEVNENTRIVIACAGAEGIADDDSVLAEAKGENVIVIIPHGQKNSDYRTVIRMSNTLALDDPKFREQFAAQGIKFTGIPNNSCVTFGAHSNSSKEIVSATINYLTSEHKQGRETRAAVLINDAENTPLSSYFSKKANFDKHKKELDDSIVFATTQAYYLKKSNKHGLVAAKSYYAPASYLGDLEAMAKAGATVMLATYNMGAGNWHTQSVELTSVMGLYDLASGVLDDGPISFVSKKNKSQTMVAKLKYYFFDVEKNKWVAFPSAVEAQRQLDISTAKVSLFNTGFLSKSDGKYTIKLNGESQEISKSDLESFLAECKAAYRETNMSATTFEKFMEEYSKTHLPGSSNKNDFVPPTLYDIGKACDALLESLENIGQHMRSFGTFSGLEVKPKGELSDYLQDMNAFPRGVSTSGLQASMECVNKLGSNLEAAYNATANLYDTFASVENQNGKYYQSNTYGNAANQASEDVTNFAQDVQ